MHVGARRRGRADRPAAGRARATCASNASSTRRARPAPRRSIRATASCRRTPSSPRPARRPGSSSSGPPAATIRADGARRIAAKALMESAGVPVVPGYHGEDQDLATARRRPPTDRLSGADQGLGRRRRQGHAGGRQRRRVRRRARRRQARSRRGVRRRPAADRELPRQRRATSRCRCSATATATSCHLFERDCSLQRRHQKVIEEAPAHRHARRALRAAMGAAAARRPRRRSATSAPARSSSSPTRRLSDFYFMEMNTRLQVEHPVTEMITGLDLVEWQLRVAPASRCRCAQDEIAAERPRHRGAPLRRGPRQGLPAVDRHASRAGASRRRATASASTPASARATRSRPTTTRCWPS